VISQALSLVNKLVFSSIELFYKVIHPWLGQEYAFMIMQGL